ncbi:MAG: PD40 domain-containing protein [Acidobacteria bacterium]|nr:PD40 domain-containing protein [Acidobacteriota bacterium]
MNEFQMRYFEFGGFRLDTTDRTLWRDGERVSLTHKSYQLLLTLIENKGHLLTHDELMSKVWQKTSVDQSSLKQNIALIRKALGDGSEESQFIQTVPKYGYRFVAPVRPLPDEGIALVAERRSVIEIDIHEKTAGRPEPPKLRGRRLMSFAFAGVLLLLFFPVWLVFRQNPVKTSAQPAFAIENIVPHKLTDTGNIDLGMLSPNGEFVVFTTLDGEKDSALWLRAVDSKESIRIVALTAPERIGAYTVTNDGKWVYYVTTSNGDWGRSAKLYRISILGGKPVKITEYIDSFVSFSPDDKRMVFDRFTAEGCQLVTANAIDGTDERVLAQGKTNLEFLEPKWSPDGTRILFFNLDRRPDATYSSISSIAVADGAITEIIPPRPQRIWHLAWTRDGEIVVNATDPATRLPQIYTFSPKDGELKRITNDLFYYNGVSVGGNSILATKKERVSGIWTLDLTNTAATPQKVIEGASFDPLVWTPDGQHLVYEASDVGRRHIFLVNADGSGKFQISPDNFDELRPDLSADGKSLVFLSNRSGTYELWTSAIDGSRPRQLTSGNTWVWQPRFAPDGASVYFTVTEKNTILLQNVSIEGGTPQTIFPDTTSIELYDVSPDGKKIAYSFTDAQANRTRTVLRSLETGEILKSFDIAPARFLRFNREGTALFFKNSDTRVAPVSSVWIQPLDGAKARELVDFKLDDLFWMDYAPDGKRVAATRGRLTSDLILLSSVKN